jgi:hypothetical protein
VIDFKGKQITIGVVGSQHRVGTTTVATQFACYLSSIGAKVSYVEANDSGHMKLIAEYYGMEKNGEGYLYKGVAFEALNSKNETEFECIVYDLGVLDVQSKVGFENCMIRILCAGDKPYEQLCEMIGKISTDYFKIINFSEGSSCNEVYYTNYEPTFFNINVNNYIWKLLIRKCISK